MEAVGAAASITAVIALAAQSAQLVYGTVLGLRDGSHQATQLLSSLQDLHTTLQHIEHLSQAGRINAYGHCDLRSAAEKCAKDINLLQIKLDKLCSGSSASRGLGTAWKNIRLFVQKDDLVRCRQLVQSHVQTLTLLLNVAELGEIQNVNTSMQASFDELRSHVQSLSKDRNALCTGSIPNLGSVLGEGAAHSPSHCSPINQVLAGGTEASTKAQEYFDIAAVKKQEAEAACARSQEVMQAVAGMSDRVENLSHMSTEQYHTLKDMLGQLLGQMSMEDDKPATPISTPKSSNSSLHTTGTETPDTIDEFDVEKPEEILGQSIGRICRLASMTEKTIFSEEAQLIIEDFDGVIKSASKQIPSTPLRELHRKRKREEWPEGYVALEEKEWQNRQDMRRLRGLLATSQAVSLAKSASSWQSVASRRDFRLRNRCRTYKTPGGLVTMFSTTQRKPQHVLIGAGDDASCSEGDLIEVYANTMTFTPEPAVSNSRSASKLFATFMQQITLGGSYAVVPTLSFHAIVPEGSDVFKFVSQGQLDDLTKLLQDGKASLTDCDPSGRSLLSYAHYFCQPHICKYLIEEGADVNAREAGVGCHNWTRPVLMQISMEQKIRDATAGGCRQILLEAGADPTLDDPGAYYRESMFENLFAREGRVVDILRIVIDTSPFVDLESRFSNGQTPLLAAAAGGRDGIEPDVIALLLSRGASPRAVDLKGNTCLHIALRENTSARFQKDLTRSLVLMIEAGADIRAVNKAGKRVVDQAIGTWGAWSDALASCGFDANGLRKMIEERCSTAIKSDHDCTTSSVIRRAHRSTSADEGRCLDWSVLEVPDASAMQSIYATESAICQSKLAVGTYGWESQIW